jgi:hypothetical protein
VLSRQEARLNAAHGLSPSDPGGPIQQIGHTEELPPPKVVPSLELQTSDRYPIDLMTALQLAGANNLQIALASERIRQA